MVLTEYQQNLVQQVHNMIPYIIKQRHLDFDEYYDLLALTVCKAAVHYKTDSGITFPAFAWRCMENTLRSAHRSEHKVSRIPSNLIKSCYDLVPGCDDNPTELIEFVEDDASHTDMWVSELYVQSFRQTLSPERRYVLDKLMDGYTQTEIAAQMSCSKANISYINRKIQQAWHSFNAA